METGLGDANHRYRVFERGMKMCAQSRPVVCTEPDIAINDDKLRPGIEFRDEGQKAGQFAFEEEPRPIRCYLSGVMRLNLRGGVAMPFPEQDARRNGRTVRAIVDVSGEYHDIQRIFRASAQALNLASDSGRRQSIPKHSRAGKPLSLKKVAGTS